MKMNKNSEYWYFKGVDDAMEMINDLIPPDGVEGMKIFVKGMKRQLKMTFDLKKRVYEVEINGKQYKG